MRFKEIAKDTIKDLDEPLPLDLSGWFQRGGFRIWLIFEDMSYKIYKRKLKKDYVFTIKKKDYFIVPECILQGRHPVLMYYYNNPFPIKFSFRKSRLTSLLMRSEKERQELTDEIKEQMANLYIDASNVHSTLNSNLINKLNAEGFWSVKNIIIIVGVALVVVLIILQLTGTVDIIGELNRALGGSK